MIFYPKIFSSLKGYKREKFFSDLNAGLIVGIVALPIALAYAIASGVSPDRGLITAIVGGFVISLLGGSRVQIGGPAGAFIVVIYSIVQQHGLDGLFIATFMAGIILVLMGLFRMGAIIRFIPYPIVIGFMSAIALIIFTTQLNDFFGITLAAGDDSAPDFFGKWQQFFKNIQSINIHSFAIGVITIVFIIFVPRLVKKIPGSLVAIILTTFAVSYFELDVSTIGSKYENLTTVIPKPQLPSFSLEKIQLLIQPAFTLAFLGAIESLLSAMVADGVVGGNHRSNTELISQGITNMVLPFFGGIPAAGQIAKTMTNIRSGGKTPVSGMIHSVVIFLVMLLFMNYARLIPMACMAGILITVAYKMSEWHTFRGFLKYPKSDGAVLLTTFFLTLFFDLSIAIQVGLLLAMVLFLKRVTETTNIEVFKAQQDKDSETDSQTMFDTYFQNMKIPKGVDIYEIKGPYFFGVAHRFNEIVREGLKDTYVRILRMRRVPFIDSTGLKNIENLYERFKEENIQLIFSGVHPTALEDLKKSGLYDKVGAENIFDDIVPALKRAKDIVETTKEKQKKTRLKVKAGEDN